MTSGGLVESILGKENRGEKLHNLPGQEYFRYGIKVQATQAGEIAQCLQAAYVVSVE